ncbi:MAG: hypothetical protein ACKPKO_49310, partial [Candidatus Fonsibacter sp.]
AATANRNVVMQKSHMSRKGVRAHEESLRVLYEVYRRLRKSDSAQLSEDVFAYCQLKCNVRAFIIPHNARVRTSRW